MFWNLLLALFSVSVLSLYRRSRQRWHVPLPPGPKGLPLVGNLFDVPAEYPWISYARWAAKYGDILYMNTPESPTIILNSAQAAIDLLDKRSGNYSDRPDFTMAKLSGWDFSFTFMRYSEQWRVHRRMFHQYFQLRAVSAYYPVQLQATSILLQQLLESPDAFTRHIRHHSGSIIMKIVYGYDVDPNGDPFVEQVDRAMDSARIAGRVGSFLVDYFPSLRYIPSWLPGGTFKRHAHAWKKDVEEMMDVPFQYASESLANGTAPTSFVSENLRKVERLEPSKSSAWLGVTKNAAGLAFAAGADTTVSTILSAILAFVLYPEVQEKAQAELDAVVGQDRLPNFEDRPQLPYINAILSEALRWNPVAPMSIAHRSVKEDIYNGYYIPAGATVIGNAWAILHNEKDYPNPMMFNPDRYIPEDGKELPPEPVAAFGFGRRICPGRYLAENTAWIAIASMLSTLSFSKAINCDGAVIEPSTIFTSGHLSFPLPFKCTIKARSAQSQALIESSGLK